ncbi:hypothetical protein HMSSN139_15500 [Paenibacillus sp. HMSSN-139]|nr:hypothetical protein HMSSN139_15500 [Paenibacillus sp. HMSSN-139]
MFDTSLTIGDEVLQQVLGQTANSQMRSIVATIQQEQNRIIRHDRARLLIVQGAPAAENLGRLQRIAYLLYKYRERMTADQIVLFSPNAMFQTYVSGVLPELGEENMQQVTFQEYLDHRLSGLFEVEDAYAQLEYVLTAMEDPDYQARMDAIRLKASASFSRGSRLIGRLWSKAACGSNLCSSAGSRWSRRKRWQSSLRRRRNPAFVREDRAINDMVE